jgi:flagellin-specific chaperone FliS
MRTFGIPMHFTTPSVDSMNNNNNTDESTDIKKLETHVKELQQTLNREKLKTLALNTR